MRLNDPGAMKLFHPTRHAAEILSDGFGEMTGTYLTPTDYSGVWLFDQPLGDHIGDDDLDVILELEIPEDVVAPSEWSLARSIASSCYPQASSTSTGPHASEPKYQASARRCDEGRSWGCKGQTEGVAPLRQRRSSLCPPRLESPFLAVGSSSRRSACTALGAKVL